MHYLFSILSSLNKSSTVSENADDNDGDDDDESCHNRRNIYHFKSNKLLLHNVLPHQIPSSSVTSQTKHVLCWIIECSTAANNKAKQSIFSNKMTPKPITVDWERSQTGVRQTQIFLLSPKNKKMNYLAEKNLALTLFLITLVRDNE